MANVLIEPGLLRVFRWFVAIRLGFLGLVVLSLRDRPDGETLVTPGPGIVVWVALLLYLSAPGLEKRLGRAYLPIALAVASVGPIIEHTITVARRLNRGEGANAAVADFWLLFFVLFVPLILTAWQYRYRAVIALAVGTTLLDGIRLGAQLESTNADLQLVGALLVGRGLMYAFVGYFIVKIVSVQREQRRALGRHASTLEQLATSRERNRLARELHDTLAHTLSAVAVQLEGVRTLFDADPERAKAMLDQSLDGTRTGLSEARRAIQALRAAPLDELGLAGALGALAARVADGNSVRVACDIADDLGELDPDVEQAVYRIAEEALANTARHSGAGKATLRLERRGNRLRLVVWDDGEGFDAPAASGDGHHGVRGMKERAALIGGTLELVSAPGGGTTVQLDAGLF